MNARRLNIGIRIAAERSKALREALRRVAGGDRTLQEPGLYFENAEELRRILTEKRLERTPAPLEWQEKNIVRRVLVYR
jgi:predicted transcriptional regulator